MNTIIGYALYYIFSENQMNESVVEPSGTFWTFILLSLYIVKTTLNGSFPVKLKSFIKML